MSIDISAKLIDEVSGQAKNIENSINGIGTAAGDSSGGFSSMGTAGVAAGMLIAEALTAAIGAIRDLAGETVGLASDFQSQVAIMSTAVDESAGSMENLSAAAMAVGGDVNLVGVSAAGAAESMTGLYKMGLSTGEIFGDMQGYMAGTAELGGVLRASIDLAAASELDMVQASELAASTLATFGGEMQTEAERSQFVNDAMNNFVQTANSASLSVSDLSAALGNIGSTAAAFGFSVEDVNTSLALLSTRGIKGAEAGTALKSMFTNMMRQTPDVTGMLKELNVTLYDQEGQMRSMPDIIAQLSGAMSGMTEEQRNIAVQTLAGTYGMKAMNVLLAEGSVGWDEMKDSIAGASTIQEVAATMTETFAGKMEALDGVVETLKIQVGSALLPALTGLSEIGGVLIERFGPALTGAMESFGGVLSEVVRMIQQGEGFVDSFTGVLGQLFMAFGMAEDSAFDMADSIGLVVQAAVDFGSKAAEFVGQFVTWKDVLIGIGVIVGAALLPALLSVASAIAGVIAVVAVATAIVAGLRLAWENDFLGIRTAIENVVGAVSEFVSGFGGIQGLIHEVGNAIKELVALFTGFGAETYDTLDAVRELAIGFGLPIETVNKLEDAIRKVADFLAPTFERIKESVLGLGDSMSPVSGKMDELKAALSSLGEALKPIATLIGAVLVVALKLLGEIMAQVFSRAGDVIGIVVTYITGQINALTAVIGGIVQFVTGVFSGDWASAWAGLTQVVEGVVDGIRGSLEALIGIVDNIVGAIWDSLANLISDLTGQAIPSWQQFKDSISEVWESVKTAVGNGVDAVLGFIDKLREFSLAETVAGWGLAFTNWIEGMKADAQTGATGIVENFIQYLKDAAGSIGDTLSDWGTAFVDWFNDTKSDIADWASGLVEDFVSALTEAPGEIADTLSGWGESFINWFNDIDWYQLGYDIVWAILTGLKFMVVELPATIAEWTEAIIDYLGDKATEFVESGIEIVTNVIEGLRDFIVQAGEEVSTWPEKIHSFITGLASQIVETGVEIVTNIVTGLRDFVVQAGEEVSSWPEKIHSFITGLVSQIVETGVEIVTNIVTGLKDFVVQAAVEVGTWPQQIRGFIVGVGDQVVGVGTDIITFIITGLKTFATEAPGAVTQWIADLKTGVSNAIGTVEEIGTNIITGIITGLKNASTALTAAIVGISEGAVQAVKDFFGITSPARLMMEIGLYIMQGWVAGIEAMKSAPATAVAGAAQEFDTAVMGEMAVTIDKIGDAVAQILGALSGLTDSGIDRSILAKWEEFHDILFWIIRSFVVLFWEIVGEAGQLGNNLDRIPKITEAINIISASLKNSLEAISKLAETTIPTNTIDKMVELKVFLSALVGHFVEISQGMTGELADAVSAFAQAAESILGLIGAAIAGAAALSAVDFGPIVQGFRLAEQMQIFVQIVRTLVAKFIDAGLVMGDELAGAIQNFADAAGAVFGLIQDAVTAIEAIRTYVPLFSLDGSADFLISNIMFWIKLMVAQFQAAATGMTDELAGAIENFAGAAGAVLEIIGNALEAIAAINEYTPRFSLDGSANLLVSNLVFWIDTFVAQFNAVANHLTTEGAAAIKNFTDGAGAVLDLIAPAIEAIYKISRFEGVDLTAANLEALDNLVLWIDTFIQRFKDVAMMLDQEAAAAVEAFGKAGKAVADALQPAAAGIIIISEWNPVDPGDAGMLAGIDNLIAWIKIFIDKFKEVALLLDSDAAAALEDFAGATEKVLGLIKPAVEGLTELGKFEGLELTLENYYKLLDLVSWVKLVTEQFKEIAMLLSEETATAVGQFAEAAKKVLELIGPAIEGLTALGTFQGIAGLEGLLASFGAQLQAAVVSLANALLAISNKINEGGGSVAYASGIAEAAGKILNIIGGAISALDSLSKFKELAGLDARLISFTTQLETATYALIDSLNEINDRIVGQGQTVAAAAAIAKAIGALFGSISTALKGLNDIGESKMPNITPQMNYIADQAALLQDKLSQAQASMGGDTLVQAAVKFADSIDQIVEQVKAAIATLNTLLSSGAQGSLQAFLSSLTTTMRNQIDPIGTVGKDTGEAYRHGVLIALDALISDVRGRMQDLIAALRAQIPDAQAAGVALGQAFANGLHGASNAANAAAQALGSNAGKAIAAGIKSQLGSITEAGRAAGAAATAGAKQELQIGSPSQIWTDMGDNLALSLAGGVADSRAALGIVRESVSQITASAAAVSTGRSSGGTGGDTFNFYIYPQDGSPVSGGLAAQMQAMIESAMSKAGRNTDSMIRMKAA